MRPLLLSVWIILRGSYPSFSAFGPFNFKPIFHHHTNFKTLLSGALEVLMVHHYLRLKKFSILKLHLRTTIACSSFTSFNHLSHYSQFFYKARFKNVNLFQSNWHIKEQSEHNANFPFAYAQFHPQEMLNECRKLHPGKLVTKIPKSNTSQTSTS